MSDLKEFDVKEETLNEPIAAVETTAAFADAEVAAASESMTAMEEEVAAEAAAKEAAAEADKKTEGEDPKKESKKEVVRAIKFVLFSISAGIIQIGSFTLFNEVFHWSYWVSYLVALILSVIWNFTFNRKFTFKSANNVPIAMLKVLAFYAVFTPLSTMNEHWLTGLGWNEYLVTLINMALNFVTEFIYDRFVVFRTSLDTNDLAQKEREKEAAKAAAEAEAKETK